jgi:hypothetical protein
MHIRYYFCFVLVTLFVFSSAFAQSKSTVSIAIIADKAGGGQSPLISLLEVQLSRNDYIRLLERAQIDKILQEQQLSAAGLLDRNNTIKIGQLLRADALVIITLENEIKAITTGSVPNTAPVSTEAGGLDESDGSATKNQPTGDLIRVRVAEAAHGLRLLDRFEQLDSLKLNEIAERINNNIKKVVDKLLLPTGQLIPVGIVDIHRVQLGERYTMLERALPKLLSVRLGLEPKIVMLEREDLKVLQDEKLRTQGEDSKFWSSAVLIEGNLQPKNGSLEMQLTLARPAGKDTKIIAVPVEPNEPSIAIDKAAIDILRQILNVPPSTQWQLAAEAEQFYQQGQMLAAHSRIKDAMPLYETASALHPKNVFYTIALFEYEWRVREHPYSSSRMINIGTHFYSDLELAELVSLLINQIRDKLNEDQSFVRDIPDRLLDDIGLWRPLGPGYLSEPVSVATDQIRLMNRENRRIFIETMNKVLTLQATQKYNPQINIPARRAMLAWISTDDPNELITNLKKTFIEYAMPPSLGGQINSAPQRNTICEIFYLSPSFSTDHLELATHLQGSSGEFFKLYREFFVELAKVDDSVVKYNSCLILGQMADRRSSQQEIINAKNYLYEAMKILSKQLQKSDDIFCYYPKRCANDIEQCLRGYDLESRELITAWSEFYEPLIRQKNVSMLSLLDPGLQQPFKYGSNKDNVIIYYDAEAKEWYLVLEKIAEVLRTYSSNNKQVTLALSRIRDKQTEIKKYYPEVAVSKADASISVQMILTKNAWFNPYVFHPIISDRIGYIRYLNDKKNILWIGFCSREDIRKSVGGAIEKSVNVGLISIDIAKYDVTSLYQTQIPTFYNGNDIGMPIITGIETIETKIYMSIANAGIIEFSLSSEQNREYLQTPKILTNKNGLPSVLISSITKEGNNLWVAYGYRRQESGLGLYEPETEKWESVFCSTLKAESPFSSGNPYLIQNIRITKPETLFFILNEPELGTANMDKWSGLWKMNTKNHKVDLVLGNEAFQKVGDLALEDFRNKWWIWKEHTSPIIEFDPISEQYNSVGWDPYSTYNTGVFHQLSSATIHKDTLWGRWGQNQIIKIKVGQKIQDAHVFDNNILDGGPVSRFVSTPYGLIAIGQGSVGLIETQ